MHETSLNQTLRDYLTGEEIEATTYEDFRQALARLLVAELGYPRERLSPKVPINFPVDGQNYCRVADLVAFDGQGRPLLVVFFAAGQPGSFDREIVAAARLFPGGSVGLVLCTNTEDAVLHETATGARLAKGIQAIPRYEALPALAAAHPAPQLTKDQLARERRILYTYSEFLYGACCHTVCPSKPKK
jgi:hypothetical protein